jgi:hypothetical protein
LSDGKRTQPPDRKFVGWRGRYVAYGKNKPSDDEQEKKEGLMGIRYKYLQGAGISD